MGVKLISYSFSEHGGMNGGRESTYIAYTDDGRCHVDMSSKPFHSQPITRVRYDSDGLLEKLSEVCERYHVTSWTDLPDQQMTMYDAPTVSICFTFENNIIISLGSRKQYPVQFHEMYQELNKLIQESEDNAIDRTVEVIEEKPFMGMMMPELNGKTISVQESGNQGEDITKWAKFCINCGAKFTGNQKFCPECGSVRPKD